MPERRHAASTWLGPVAVIAWFAATEDFQPRHLLRIDSPEIIFRQGMSSAVGSHYYRRGDSRASADWLQAHAVPADLVVSGPGVAVLPFYFHQVDLVYLEHDDQRLYAWACRLGTVDRWSNLPLVYDIEGLKSRIEEHPRSFIVVFESRADRLKADLAQFQPRIVWENERGGDVIVQIERGPAAAPSR
jgi:hypothetical protein